VCRNCLREVQPAFTPYLPRRLRLHQ
jgi:hypothetical protein